MQTFQKRVVEEKAELDARLEKLQEYLKEPTGEPTEAELHRLRNQASVMQTYSRILRERIKAFTA